MGSMKDAFGDTPAAYPERPGFKERTTSRDAADKVASGTEAARIQIHAIIALAPDGLTADQAAKIMNRPPLYVRPRVAELRKLGMLEMTGERRKNDSGLSANVWRAKRKQ